METAAGLNTPAVLPHKRAVVFAYHNVGVRCLQVLLDAGVEVALVVTHEDSAAENIWFGSVLALARREGLAVITPTDPNTPEVIARVKAARPDFLFSFYYRQMLAAPLLEIAPLGALNMHGSLLPSYRGRAPVNWAVLFGEPCTGASLHYMVIKPDAGDLVAQTAVPILANDTAGQVFEKVTVAAEQTLWRVLPDLLAERAPRTALQIKPGHYFGGRKPEDGRVDWSKGPTAVHNLVRAVAPPYPGAWFLLQGQRFEVHETRGLTEAPPNWAPSNRGPADVIGNGAWLVEFAAQLLVCWPDASVFAADRSGRRYHALELSRLLIDGRPCTANTLRESLTGCGTPVLLPLAQDTSLS